MIFLEKVKLETQSGSVVGWGWGREVVRWMKNGEERTFGGKGNALKLDCGHSQFIRTHQSMHLQ